jgi:hypothetical protein
MYNLRGSDASTKKFIHHSPHVEVLLFKMEQLMLRDLKKYLFFIRNYLHL